MTISKETLARARYETSVAMSTVIITDAIEHRRLLADVLADRDRLEEDLAEERRDHLATIRDHRDYLAKLLHPEHIAVRHIDGEARISASFGDVTFDGYRQRPTTRVVTIGTLSSLTRELVTRKDQRYWSPLYGAPGSEVADVIIFDFDEGNNEQINDLLRALDDDCDPIAHLVNTTYSYTPENPKIRLVLIPDRAVNAVEYHATWLREAGKIAASCGLVADGKQSHISSIFYIGQPETGVRPPQRNRWVPGRTIPASAEEV